MIKRTLKQKLAEKNNDYSFLEPFNDPSPIPTSIIIPVYNNKRVFKRCFKSLEKHPPWL